MKNQKEINNNKCYANLFVATVKQALKDLEGIKKGYKTIPKYVNEEEINDFFNMIGFSENEVRKWLVQR